MFQEISVSDNVYAASTNLLKIRNHASFFRTLRVIIFPQNLSCSKKVGWVSEISDSILPFQLSDRINQ